MVKIINPRGVIMDFTVVRANIVNISADAVVLPANEKLREGSGTSRAIFEAAGREELTKACREIGYCEIGSAVPTLAFDLNAKFIIHAVVPKWKDGEHDEYGLLSSAYLTSMKVADILGCESIAFPLLASGNNGFDRALAFEIAKRSINEFNGEKLQKVILVVYGENTESFVRSKGYDITIIAETAPAHKIELPEEAKEAAKKLLKATWNWLKDEKHRRILLEAGLEIALIVLPGKGKPAKAIGAIKKILKK